MMNYSESKTLSSYEAKEWLESHFSRVLYNIVWENDEPVELIITVRNTQEYFMCRGRSLVEIVDQLETARAREWLR